MELIDIVTERREHPLDALERLAALHEWSFERSDDDELSVAVEGAWSGYSIAFTWIDEFEALHVASAFDLKVPDRRRTEILNLVSMINEQMWVGHFDLWTSESVVMFRHSLLLAGGAEPTRGQCEMLMNVAVEASDRYYQAFQFVLWAGKPPREALDAVLFETVGEA